jgi:glyoxylase-like metal-dependent hydrolase (beta-lactamase superfamily II)
MMVEYEILVLGELKTNCYLIWEKNTKQALIIDPADDGVAIADHIYQKQLKPVGILLTHGHFDHLLGLIDLKLIFNIPLYGSSEDDFFFKNTAKSASFWLKRKIDIPDIKGVDVDLAKVNKIELGEELIEVIRTPGHTPGGVCFYCHRAKILFSGDTIFAGTKGRTDMAYGSETRLLKSIGELLKLPEDVTVLPGHGRGTTIGQEKQFY